LAKGTTPCLECGDYRIPYKNKENISWNIKWFPNDNLFILLLYVREEEGIKVYSDLIPNEILSLTLGNTEKIKNLVDAGVNRIGKLNGIDFENMN
jgi:hypothetical protein